jgi:hypothetical protein
MSVHGPVQGVEDGSVTKIKSFLRVHGPALISRFHIYPHFKESSCTSFSMIPEGEKVLETLHAMVLVGYRDDEKLKETYFLVQNWWKDRYFIEVTASYLEAAQADVVFVREKFTNIPIHLPVINATYTETSAE